ncbi:MAG: hypothetical protein AB7T10_05765 [bacterium]
MRNDRIYFYLAGAGCCLPSVIGLSRLRTELEDNGFFETASIQSADLILLYGCINKKSAIELSELLSFDSKESSIIKIGECIVKECLVLRDYPVVNNRIVMHIKGCPPGAQSILDSMNRWKQSAQKEKK